MCELLLQLVYYLGVGAAWEPLRRARRTKKGESARTSVYLGITALLLAVVLGLVGWSVAFFLGPEINGPDGAIFFSLAMLVGLFCVPFAVAALAAAVVGLVMAVITLGARRHRGDLPQAIFGLFLNLLALALPMATILVLL